jgi:hypothetical protein
LEKNIYGRAEKERQRVAVEKEKAAERLSAEKERQRVEKEKAAERLSAEKERQRVAVEKEKAAERLSAEKERQRVAVEKEKAAERLSAEKERQRVEKEKAAEIERLRLENIANKAKSDRIFRLNSRGVLPNNNAISSGANRSINYEHGSMTRTDVHDLQSVPDRIALEISSKILQKLKNPMYCLDNLQRLRLSGCDRLDGAPKGDVFSRQKFVSYELFDFLCDESGDFALEDVHVYIYYLLNDAADLIESTMKAVTDSDTNGVHNMSRSDKDLVDEDNYDNFTVLHNQPGDNDTLRRAANGCLKYNEELRNFLSNIRYVLDFDGVVSLKAFATSGSGEEDSITLLLALVGCSRQEEHTDYDFNLFKAHEDYLWMTAAQKKKYKDSYLNFNGASMFFNMSWSDDQFLDLDYYEEGTWNHRTLKMIRMSILIISGDLKHAGSSNKSGKVIRKFFLYLDPCRNCRLKHVTNEVELCNGKATKKKDNYIYFDSYFRLPECI